MMLELLKNVGWFVLTFVLTALFLLLSYYLFMAKFAYRRLVYRARDYLAHHGRGNFDDKNQYVIGVDVIVRIACVCGFALVGAILGIILVPPNRWLMLAVILAAGVFAFRVARLEMCFVIQIGRLKSIDKEEQRAYFVNLKNEVFTYDYEDTAAEEKLIENRKYLVVDYLVFAMVGPVDEYEWG